MKILKPAKRIDSQPRLTSIDGTWIPEIVFFSLFLIDWYLGFPI